MKTRLLLIPVFFVWYCCCAVSQDINSALKLETKRNADESVNILARTYSPGTFGIVMEFTGLTNTSHPRWSYASVRGSGTVATLRPLSSEQGVGYSYVYTYNRGRANPRHSASVTYRLPFSAGKTCLCNTLSYLWEDIRDRPEEWHPCSIWKKAIRYLQCAKAVWSIYTTEKILYPIQQWCRIRRTATK